MSPVGAFVRGSWGQFPCRNAQPRPPPPPGTNTLGFLAGIPERRPSPSPVHLRGPAASTLGAPEQRRSPPSGRQGVSGPDSPQVHRSLRGGLPLRRLSYSAGLPRTSILPRARCPPPGRGGADRMPPGRAEAARWATEGAGGRPQGARGNEGSAHVMLAKAGR